MFTAAIGFGNLVNVPSSWLPLSANACRMNFGASEEFADGAAAAIAAQADRRTILFGHSLGAMIAFEVARRLREVSVVTDLVASGCAAPALLPTPRVVKTARLTGREFVDAVAFFGGLPSELVMSEELSALLLPSLMADFQFVARYHYRPADPLAVRVHRMAPRTAFLKNHLASHGISRSSQCSFNRTRTLV